MLANRVYSFYAADRNGNTLLHVCAKRSNSVVINTVLEKMLSYQMDINIRNNSNHTALDVAILNNNLQCSKTLNQVGGQFTLPKMRLKTAPVPQFQTEHLPTTWIKGCRSGIDITAASWKSSPSLPATFKMQDCPGKDGMGVSGIAETSLPPLSTQAEHGHAACKDTEEIVHRLLVLKATRHTLTYKRPSKQMLPIDTDFIATLPSNSTSENFSKQEKKRLKKRSAMLFH